MTSATTNYTYSGSATLTGNVTGNTLAVSSFTLTNSDFSMTLNGLLNTTANDATIGGSGNIAIGSNNELDIITATGNVNISEHITGTGSVVFASTAGSFAGKLNLSSLNTYSGGTIIDSSTVVLSGAGTLGAPVSGLTLNGGNLDLGSLRGKAWN